MKKSPKENSGDGDGERQISYGLMINLEGVINLEKVIS